MVACAVSLAEGRREGAREVLSERMRSASASLAFEAAGAAKKRLARLDEFDCQAWSHVAPIEQFRFILVQSGGSRREARVFFVDQGRVAAGTPLAYPLQSRPVARAVGQMRKHMERRRGPGVVDLWRLALVAWYLPASQSRRGVILRWRDDMSADELGESIESSSKVLKLRAPAVRKPRKK